MHSTRESSLNSNSDARLCRKLTKRFSDQVFLLYWRIANKLLRCHAILALSFCRLSVFFFFFGFLKVKFKLSRFSSPSPSNNDTFLFIFYFLEQTYNRKVLDRSTKIINVRIICFIFSRRVSLELSNSTFSSMFKSKWRRWRVHHQDGVVRCFRRRKRTPLVARKRCPWEGNRNWEKFVTNRKGQVPPFRRQSKGYKYIKTTNASNL